MNELKKNRRRNASSPPSDEPRKTSMDEFDNKRKVIREKMKEKRVNYVVKDLPIY